jgi:hypothetical protein
VTAQDGLGAADLWVKRNLTVETNLSVWGLTTGTFALAGQGPILTNRQVISDFEVAVTQAGGLDFAPLTASIVTATGGFQGGGDSITNLTGANVTGTVPDATRSVYVTTGLLTNFVVLSALDNIPTNSIPASTATYTNWLHFNWTNTGPVYAATNIAAAGSFLLRVPTTTLTAWP